MGILPKLKYSYKVGFHISYPCLKTKRLAELLNLSLSERIFQKKGVGYIASNYPKDKAASTDDIG